jgi:hypothetical protein
MTGYRTLIAAGIVAALGVLQGFDWITLVSTPSGFGWSAAGTALLFAVLRAVTTTPVGTPAASK